MRTLKTLLVATALVVTAGLAKADTQDRHLTGFTSVAVAGSYDVFITQGSSESVKVDAPANIIDKIITEVKGGVLVIHTKEGTNWNWDSGNKKMIVYVSIKDISAVSLAGSGDVVFKDGLRASSLKIKLTGSGDISGKVDVKNLESSIGGSGDITLSGRADNSTVSVVGSGDFTGQNLVTTNTQVKVAGSGDARVNANDKIDASVVGSGDVHYTGSAKNISSSKAGSGSVSRM
ncbi:MULTISPECIES: head GIN domain-containing protein [unclassified Mucilaginibacter]|uniref:head GIN domain-containing protein n=1 Tax=unclassified Mucilaginibacter TaxID=2617802 RepID=UPI002AC94FD3|nr:MULTISPECIES: head GIN domain-containing protein [unclassified Mucilaginibacter]MEB0277529.1 head GIN domain-containing protein [Mucilaginibacter sp. 10B2]MEB0299444.1 head GIN domain-containing protein [Mucilaginibacter sp. 5C4]WPX24841.1 head GIN domain-containing protein [Mucilaginibacter sp. 5C4]